MVATYLRALLRALVTVTSMVDQQPTQLKLGFTRPQIAMHWYLDLAGLFVIISADPPATDDDVSATLVDLGVTPETRPHVGVCIPVAQLRRLSSLRSDVTVRAAPTAEALWRLVRQGPDSNIPATLTTASFNTFLLEWENMGAPMDATIDATAIVALLAAEIPFVATPDAWERIDAVTRTGTITGRATKNLEGFLEIVSSRPQLVESMALPGLFRIDATHFGLPLAARDALVASPGGLIVDSFEPLEVPPPSPPALELSGHHLADLEDLVTALCAYQAQVISWDPGLGRRVFALAAIDRLDAWPALIVTSPSHLWAWQRHLDLMGRSYSLNHADADAHLITYHDVLRRRNLPPAPALIFDQLSSPEAVVAYPALRRLAGLRDSFRVDVEGDWPEDIDDQLGVMEILRPVEFTTEVAMAERYPPDAYSHATEHISFYRSVRHRSDYDTDPRPFRRSSTQVVSLSPEHLVAIDELADRLIGLPAHQALSDLLEAVTAGPPHLISPKVVSAAQIARSEALSGHSCIVVTRSRKAITLLRSLLRPIPVDVAEPGAPITARRGSVTLLRFERTWPDMRSYDHAVVLDYPWSLSVLDEAVGPASAPGVDKVTVVHAVGTLDDRMAILASRRRELASVSNDNEPPTIEEITYLIEPRSY
jgi:hypothetical protein